MPIEFAKHKYSDRKILSMLRPYVAEWFSKTYKKFTPPQRMAIPFIKNGYNVLISSPTGTGKTLAVFLGILDNLYAEAEKEGKLPEGVYVVYVSPLRALNNDMRRNLLKPIHGIREAAKKHGIDLPEIKVGVRTSDTSPYEKQKMIKDPPHILITTPESLAIALNAPRFRERLKNTRIIIIDEIHELANSKRGSHLSLSIERLENLAGKPLQRIGLSATIAPLVEVAKFLAGYRDDGEPRDCLIVDARFSKPIDIKVIAPVKDLVHASAEEINNAIYSTLVKLIRKHRTTLVFTNTRSATERVVYKLRKIMEKERIVDIDEIEAHHSSLSRDVRLGIEEKLKQGKLRVIVSSTSLELGIDIGYIDLVVLLSSPKSVSRLLQRIGRAGHHIRQVSKGRVIVIDRDDLVECAVLVKAAYQHKIDRVRIPKNPLDVLAQHIVGLSLEKKWDIREAYKLIKRSYSFHTLSWNDYINVLKYLSGMYGDYFEHAKVYAKIWFDENEGVFGRKRTARMIYYQNIGTIPDESKAHVFTIDGKYVGDLEEAFVEYLIPGDLFVLGGRVYEYIRSIGFKVYVKPADGARPTVPSWFSEMLPLAYDSALEVGKFRRLVAEKIMNLPRSQVIDWLRKEYRLQKYAAESIYGYIKEQLLFTGGIIPSDKLIMIEIFDEPRRRNIIVHSLFGRRVNAALSRAYAYIISNELGVNVKITVTDNGFMLAFPVRKNIDWIQAFKKLTPENIEDILKKVLRRTEMLKRRFRHCAVRSFMILRRYRDRKRSVHRLQINAEELLRAIEDLPDFPVLKETYREILEDYMHIEAAKEVLDNVRKGNIKITVIGPNNVPSPFSHSIVVHGYSDVVLMEDMRKLLRLLHERVIEYLKTRKTSLANE
ncbi:ATP-dependent helicase [Staphylothermus hellenicus]|uniref:DEAD/H associated domain protein n=1 Tax=Staphylothermus hellenicus (strain DSM 12710 / JCM 10830 / BK20S6-10-b1 / P8) TaxID=591019 RepID=D7D8V8_STAHD|nr:ATP-dependent helicase [Staphylothermus hellenicus]ADI32204.1 DEAD/H associated domain protein [Staphylothermus hellenicus DSM 12710]